MNTFKKLPYGCTAFCLLLLLNAAAQPPLIEHPADTVSFATSLPFAGMVKHRNATEIAGSNWLIGCETLDRDFADYDQYKEYLNPLGIKRLRLQGGWAKTEKV
ncbi:MAG TPA: hypothetical protein VL307_06275, partial [Chitinophagaceae bacterium]|nr:hypothetical protein [Chitinophagaceae bacterium]